MAVMSADIRHSPYKKRLWQKAEFWVGPTQAVAQTRLTSTKCLRLRQQSLKNDRLRDQVRDLAPQRIVRAWEERPPRAQEYGPVFPARRDKWASFAIASSSLDYSLKFTVNRKQPYIQTH